MHSAVAISAAHGGEDVNVKGNPLSVASAGRTIGFASEANFSYRAVP
jgi:hypothetical protein